MKWVDHGSVRHPEDFTECPVCHFIERFPESMEPALAALPNSMKRTPAIEDVPSPETALVLTEAEWDVLALICDDWLSLCTNGPADAVALAERIIESGLLA